MRRLQYEAGLRFFETRHRGLSGLVYVRVSSYALSKAARVNLLQASCCEHVNQSVVKVR